ncbi:MAG: hypothetical protein ACXW3X_01915 [Rhodoplanes sp.]
MPLVPVHFEYLTGLRHIDVRNAHLTGSWDGEGRAAKQWSTTPMQAFMGEDGCPTTARSAARSAGA